MAASMTRWNEYKVQRLLTMANQGRSLDAIARSLNMTPEQITRKCKILGIDVHANARPRSEKASSTRRKRECLHCHTQFMSRGPGNRICNNCKGTVAANASAFDALYLTDGCR